MVAMFQPILNVAAVATVKTGGFIMCTGFLLFISLAAAFQAWLGSRSIRILHLKDSCGSTITKQDSDQSTSESPIRGLDSIRPERIISGEAFDCV